MSVIAGRITSIDTEWSVLSPAVTTLKIRVPSDFDRMCQLEEALKRGSWVKLTVMKRKPRGVGVKP